MDTSSGEVLPLTIQEEEEITTREGRPPEPGDKIDKTRVVVSRKVASLLHNGRRKKKRERQNRRVARRKGKQ
jgi:hypothetical protein